MTTHKLIWLNSSCIPNRKSESLLVTADDEDTDFERVVCPEIPDLFRICLCDEIRGLRCFIICNTLCKFALREWLELTDLKKNK